MPEFEKPKVLKKANRVKDEKGNCIECSHVEYSIDGNKYPKLQISVFKVDEEGFPLARKKSVNLPISQTGDLIKVLTSLQK